MVRRRAVTAVVVLCIAASCGGPHQDSVRARAASDYLQLATTTNHSVDAATAAMASDGQDLRAVEADLRSVATARRSFDTGLRRLRLPASDRPAVTALLRADDALEARLDEGAGAATVVELDSRRGPILAAGQTVVEAANGLRRRLRLPLLR